jgi:hypothetical protein
VGYEHISSENRRIVWTTSSQSMRMWLPTTTAQIERIEEGGRGRGSQREGMELMSVPFGMLERVHPEMRRQKLSQIFMIQCIRFLMGSHSDTMSLLFHGYIDTLNHVSLGRFNRLSETNREEEGSAYFGGHSILLWKANHPLQKPSSSHSTRIPPDSFLFDYFRDTPFSPDFSTIFGEWERTKCYVGSMSAVSSDEYSVCCVCFRVPWLSVWPFHNQSVVKSSLTTPIVNATSSPSSSSSSSSSSPQNIILLGCFATFLNGSPLFSLSSIPLSLFSSLISSAISQCHAEFCLIDMDERTFGLAIEYLKSERDVVGVAREVYHSSLSINRFIPLTWHARFLDPRHLSSLMFFVDPKAKGKL